MEYLEALMNTLKAMCQNKKIMTKQDDKNAMKIKLKSDSGQNKIL